MTNLTKMHAVRRIAGIIVLFAVIGFSMTACDGGDTHTCSYSTTWSNNATTHYKQCSCGNKIDVENHVGNPCGLCGYNSGGGGYSLNGVWASSNGTQITVNGSTGIYSTFGTLDALYTDARNKNYIQLGGQVLKSITNTGNLTWSGEYLTIRSNTSAPNVATGVDWLSCTFTLSADGQTLTIAGSAGSGTYTRKR